MSKYRYASILLKELVITDFKLRYQNSFLGYLWSVLKPLFLFAILYIVFIKFLRVDFGVKNSGNYLLLATVIWGFFAEGTGLCIGSIVGKGDLLRKISFPRYVVVLSSVASAAINLFLNMLVVSVFLVVGGIDFDLRILWIIPLFIELLVLVLGLGFVLSAAFVKLRDISYLWDVVLQALFYLTPILYSVSILPAYAQKILMMNPLAQIMQDLRYVLVSTESPTIGTVYGNDLYRLIPIAGVVILLVVAALYFRASSKNFAEEV